MMAERLIILYVFAPLAAAFIMFVLVFSFAPDRASAAALYQQLDASALGEAGFEHAGAINQAQKLGNGLSGQIGSVAYKINGENVATDIAIGWGEVILVECAPGGLYTSCNNRASSGFAPQVLSQTGNSAYVLVDMTQGGTIPPYTFIPELFYYLLWVADQEGDPSQANDLALYGSAADTYPGGAALWLNGTQFEPDAHIADVAFSICDTAVCDLPSPTPPDIDPPVLGITTIAATALTRPTVTGTTNDAAPVSVLLNSKFYTAVPTANTWSVQLPEEDALLDGDYFVVASSTDAAGNSGIATSTFYVDLTAPAINITSGPADNGYISSNLISMTFEIADAHLENTGCSFDEGATSTCTAVVSATLPDGGHTFAIEAKDEVGHSSYKSRHFTVDTVAPTLAITSGFLNGAYTNMTSAAFTFTSNAATVCSLDGGDFAPCSGSYGASGLSPGTHLFTVSATDEASNTAAQTRSWNIDTAAPILAEVSIATTTSDQTPQYKFSSSKPGAITYGGACSSASTTAALGDNVIDFNQLAVGAYSNCTITVTDASGNISAPLHVSAFTITATIVPKKHPYKKDHCKVNGWRDFISPSFKNQGKCISYVVSHKGDRDKDEDGRDDEDDGRVYDDDEDDD